MSIFLSQLLRNYPHSIHGSGDPVITDVIYDSRRAKAGCLFFCMPGARSDGHTYAPAVYAAGCRAFVVERVLDLPDDAVQVVVPASRAALAALSAVFYGEPAKKLTLIGVGGTKGKTTTALLIHGILCKCGIDSAYIGSNGVFYQDKHLETVNTTPESRELHRMFRDMLDAGVTHVVMEVSSLAPATHRIDGLTFDTVLFTNLGRDHISPTEHATFEDYRDAKRRLYTEFGAKNIIWNADDNHGLYMVQDAKNARLLSYSLRNQAVFCGSELSPYRDETSLGIDFTLEHEGVRTAIRLRTPGAFSIYNGMAAIAACTCYGVSIADCAAALRTISINGRFEIVDAVPGATFLIDYAHNGLSLTNALRELRAYEPKRLICLFGTVGGRTQERRKELAEAASQYADYSIITSDNPDFESPDAIIADVVSHMSADALYTTVADREEAIRLAVRIAETGDIVLLAGKGHETYQLIEGKKVPFSERAIVLDEAAKLSEALVTL
ncbi:MAG: UDP-N-acetylmuramoyl-L-alanyl-D-glutamate--2,6-diaminopimelate ligase [Clostridia bacterium]|nr:UDP-N-acetylmuramoyl-L-alanyl-D-glutamate--2,6-diaminopimelate ligase [Clostridia bacterium]